ncbi:phytoene desaturase family protein [Novosphingobium sp.]|uniref:phytoene desaturase family protein n=1 Tax=Novosphingobium sp. TaxID=1874826 RepID=UPI0035B11CC5
MNKSRAKPQDSVVPLDHAAPAPSPQGRRACVIGAGLGGLALAIRLQAAGIETVVIEARSAPGGRAGAVEHGGFRFDAGPDAISDPAGFAELWGLTGDDMADAVTLLPISPACRFTWPDGTSFDLSDDEAALTREIVRFAPDELGGYEDFRRSADSLLGDFRTRLAALPAKGWSALLRALPQLGRHQAWRSLDGLISSFIEHDKLRAVLSFEALRSGANPQETSATAAVLLARQQHDGLWAVKGGTATLAAALAARFELLGGTLRLHDPVLHVHTIGNRASEVQTQSGWQERFDAVASNADLVHTYRDLLSETARGPEAARSLARKDYAPGLFVVHFALEGSWPGIPHRSVLMASRYTAMLDDIYQSGVLPQDSLIMLSHPTVTDPSLAPEGKSLFTAAVPVAHQGKLPIDWEVVGPMLEKRVLDEIGRRLVPDIHDRIITKFHRSPRDFALDFNSHLGSAWGLEPSRLQSWWLHARSRDARIANFYLVGASTHPGTGIGGVLASAKLTAKLMQEDLR